MFNKEIENLIGLNKLTVVEAMRSIDKNACGILFIADENEKLIGCVTDGDIRRYLLAGGKLEDSIEKAVNKKIKKAKTLDSARRLFDQRNYIAIPIVDSKGAIIDVYLGEDLHLKPKTPLEIPVVINAGGRGTRLDPFTRVLPKPLIPVGELPIIEHIMKQFQGYACEDFHVIVNYKRELIKAYFHENENRYKIAWYDEEQPLGTGGGLSLLKGKMNDTFFFTNCDNLLTANYNSMLKFHRENNNVITMVCAYKNMSIPYGVVDMGLNGTIEGMKEKPMLSFLTNTGIYIVEPEVLDDIEDGVAIGFPDILEGQRKKGKNVAVFPVSENDWMDMGQFSELEKMRKKLYGD